MITPKSLLLRPSSSIIQFSHLLVSDRPSLLQHRQQTCFLPHTLQYYHGPHNNDRLQGKQRDLNTGEKFKS